MRRRGSEGRGALLIRMAMTLVMLMLLQIVRKCQLFSATSKRRRRVERGAAWNFVAVVVARRLLNENNAAYIIYMYTKARLRQTHTHAQIRTNTHKHVRDTVGETSQLGIKSSSSFSLSENK